METLIVGSGGREHANARTLSENNMHAAYVKRLYVEKKSEFDIEAKQLLQDLTENLLVNLHSLRILNRYDIENITDQVYERIKYSIFSEPMTDKVYDEEILLQENDKIFAIEYLPGQYNQRADSAIQCIQIISPQEDITLATAKVIVLTGDLSEDEFIKIKNYCINPVDSREAAPTKPECLHVELQTPGPVEILDGFIEKTPAQLNCFHLKHSLAMSLDDLTCVQDYFKNTEKRNPTITEIKALDTYWSDHCRHTTFLTHINKIEIEKENFSKPVYEAYQDYLQSRHYVYGDAQKDICLMDLALIGMKELRKRGLLNDLDESEEINACSIKVDVDINGKNEPWLVMFKNETHNHPTEVEPYGGAATCLGGAIRDPLSGRSYVYQAVRITGSGDPRTAIKDTLPGKLSQRKITTGAANGFSSYGNQIGLATGHVEEIYHEGFIAKRMEIGAVVGAAPESNVVRENPKPGDCVILLGGRTGRDGCGGATGASKEHTEESIYQCGAEVQKGNPIIERKIQRLFRNEMASRLIKRCNDFGAGGICVAVGELADGLIINLDSVTKKYEGLDGTELVISESQERMAVVVSNKDAEMFISYCSAENLEAVIIGEVAVEKRLCMFWRGEKIVDLSRDFLNTNGAKQTKSAYIDKPADHDFFEYNAQASLDTKKTWLETLSHLSVCSQKGLAERFDHTIGSGTVLMPFGGQTRLTPAEASVSKIPVKTGVTNTVTIMAHGYDPHLSGWSPFHGAVYAVVEALAKITVCGGDYTKTRLSFQEYFEKLGDCEKSWGKPLSGLLGAYHVQTKLGIPAIGGKDSMSGTFKDIHVPPVVTAFGLCIADARNIISPEFKKINSHVVYIPLPRDQYAMPDFTVLQNNYSKIHTFISAGKILSAHTIKSHGISEAISKMCFGNLIGMEFTNEISQELLFAPDYGSLVLEIPAEENLQLILDGVAYQLLGITTGNPTITINSNQIEISLQDAIQSWENTLECVFPTKVPHKNIRNNAPIPGTYSNITLHGKYAGAKFARPRVFIPVFPGTNCEDDSRKAFEKAGGIVEEFVFKNLSLHDITLSIDHLKKAIHTCQIVMIPGGFSAGDEPDGSAKFITAVFRNPSIKQAITDLLKTRDGLVLGICNGFQALIKLGLFENGEITDTDHTSPTLSYNTIGRHISQMTSTKIVSNRSPWLHGTNINDIHVIPISHGEGRFVANQKVLEKLIANNQIATIYEGNNPNGSVYNIEGITSPCGRIFGKMGHSERIGQHIYKNIPGNTDQKIFESGIQFFQ